MSNIFSEGKANKFSKSREPLGNDEKENWQESNKNWWESNPMRYDYLVESIDESEFSP